MRAIRVIGKILKVLLIIVLALFAGTFTIYMFNLENKLIYNVIYPFLQKHYNSQQRNRKI
jgi:flagellar basal body-associated protein FliL